MDVLNNDKFEIDIDNIINDVKRALGELFNKFRRYFQI